MVSSVTSTDWAVPSRGMFSFTVAPPGCSRTAAVRSAAALRVRLTLEDEYVARYYLARESPRVRNAVAFVGKPLSENSLHILVSLKNPEHAQIVAGFDREIARMKADGSYARLMKAHGM